MASIVVWGIGIIIFGLGAHLADGRAGAFLGLAVLGLVIGGAADMASAAFRTSMLQESATDAVRGRLQGVFIVVVAGGPRIADVIHGGMAEAVGAPAAAWGGGVLVVIGVLMVTGLWSELMSQFLAVIQGFEPAL